MELRDLTGRYRLIEEIGRGSIGIVYRANDELLNRAVAVKVLRPELLDHNRHRPRFLREGLIGGRLGHPNIVPVFEVGSIDVGEVRGAPCLVMGLLAGRSFRTIIRSGLISIPRQLSWFTQVCHGLAFAHDQGVIHRDIKPAHIFVGDFGQVVLTDWGLAKTRRASEAPPPEAERREVTRVGDIVGTPAYMAPEQAEGRIAELDHHADIYALGAILYEILTGTRPYEASRSVDVLRALRHGPPEAPSQRTPGRDIPAALEAVCLRAMARKASDRFDSALDLAANIEAWFEQAGRQAVPDERVTEPKKVPEPGPAASRLAEGRAEAAAFRRQMQSALRLQTEALRREGSVRPDAPRAEREDAWRLAEKARDRFEQAAWHLAQGVGHLQEAMAGGPDGTEARRDLARLHLDAWRAAEAGGEVVAAAFHRSRAESNDDGELSAELAGRAALSVHTEGARVTVDLYAIDDRAAVWTSGARVRLGETPLTGRTVRATRVLVRLTADDGFNARIPLRMTPGEARLLEVVVPPSHLVPPGFVFVPGGRFVFGADDRAPGVAATQYLEVPSFCMARQPVTWGEYFEFLEDLLAVGADATPHLPRARDGALVLVSDHRVVWRTAVHAPPGAPIRWVSHRDARAYAAWLGRRLGVRLRLPTEAEWAYAAGAADSRPFPWGHAFVPGLADTRRRGVIGPSAVNAFPDDESPFGMRSVAGGVREWTDTPAELADRYLIRGGSWRSAPDQCRIDARATGRSDLTHQAIGIRLAADIPGDG